MTDQAPLGKLNRREQVFVDCYLKTWKVSEAARLAGYKGRAVKADPEKVAFYADNPVFEDDLTARHIDLVKNGIPLLAEKIPANINFYDAKIAGWWVWGICAWIGSEWCKGNGPWTEEGGKLVDLRQIGAREAEAQGVNRQLPHLGNPGQGVNRKRPDLGGNGGRGRGVLRSGDEDQIGLIEYMNALADRLKNVRICNGDWKRIVTPGALSNGASVGIFLDPPYSQDLRDRSLYNADSCDVAADVLKWCEENGGNPRYRIVLAGYEGEHNLLEKVAWRKIEWKANASYQTAKSENENRHNERIWISPACVRTSQTAIAARLFP